MSYLKKEEDDLSDVGLRTFVRGMKMLWFLVGKERKGFAQAGVALLFVTAMQLAFPFVLKLVFDLLSQVEHAVSFTRLMIMLVILASLKIGTIAANQFWYVRQFIEPIIRLENLWPAICHEKLEDLPASFHDTHGTGRSIAKVLKGCERLVDASVKLCFNFIPIGIFWVFNLGMLLWLDARLAAILILPFFPAWWMHVRYFKYAIPRWQKWETAKEAAASHMIQTTLNVQTVQAFVREADEVVAQKKHRAEMQKMDFEVIRVERIVYFLMGAVVNLGYVMAIAVGAYFVWKKTGSYGTLAYVITVGSSMVQQFWDLIHVYRDIIRNLISGERVDLLLKEVNELPDNPDALIPEVMTGNLAIEDLTFHYAGRTNGAVENVSLQIPAGSTVAFVGPSGAGKTTLGKLLMRLSDPQSGRITLDGTDIRSIHRGWFRSQFASVRQDVGIFDLDIAHNVGYGHPDATPEEIEQALRAAHFKAVIEDRERFPDGIKTRVGENGVILSGGEKQRVGIARAYLHLRRGARFLVLDEATSNLDAEAERAIQEMIKRLRHGKRVTVITVAHRLSTVKDSDCLYVMNEGRIAEQGTHRELIAKGGIYAGLVHLLDMHAEKPAHIAPSIEC